MDRARDGVAFVQRSGLNVDDFEAREQRRRDGFQIVGGRYDDNGAGIERDRQTLVFEARRTRRFE